MTAGGAEMVGNQFDWPVWHMDGRHVAFDVGVSRQECYVLVNFVPSARAAK